MQQDSIKYLYIIDIDQYQLNVLLGSKHRTLQLFSPLDLPYYKTTTEKCFILSILKQEKKPQNTDNSKYDCLEELWKSN